MVQNVSLQTQMYSKFPTNLRFRKTDVQDFTMPSFKTTHTLNHYWITVSGQDLLMISVQNMLKNVFI